MSNNRFDIAKFLKHIGRPLRPNRYEVIVSPPPTIRIGSDVIEKVSFLCHRAVFPGTTIDVFQYSSGTLENLATPSAENRHEVSLEFYAPADFAPHRMFQAWKDRIISQATNTLSYLVEYAGSVELWLLDKNGGRLHGKLLHEAWPKEMASYELGYSMQNEIVKTVVTMEYSMYEDLDGGTHAP